MTFGASEIVSYLLIITTLITSARIAGMLFRRAGLPAVIGELAAGIVLGPTVLAHVTPDLYETLFKGSAVAKVAFDALLTLSSIFLLFVVGLEIKLSAMRNDKTVISWMGALGVTLPYAVGAGVAYLFIDLVPEGVSELGFVAVISAAFAVSALPVIARILLDLDILKTRIGSIIIGSAAVNDIVGWLLFIFALGLAGTGDHQLVPIWAAVLGALVLTGLAFTILPSLLNRLIAVCGSFFKDAHAAQGIVVLPLLFGLALFTEYLGLHALFGAFILGIALSESPQFEGALRESIETLNGAFFAPLYFVAVGLKADFLAGFELSLIAVMVIAAFFSKVIAAQIGGYFSGLSGRLATAVGLGLAARGGMGIIVATIAFASGVVELKIFTALIVMAVSTSFFAAFIPRFLDTEKSYSPG